MRRFGNFIFVVSSAIILFVAISCHQNTLQSNRGSKIYTPVNDTLDIVIDSTKKFSAGKMTFVKILGDSRCPEGANCMQRGSALLQFRFELMGKKLIDSTFAMSSQSKDVYPIQVSMYGFEFTIIDFLPHPSASIRIDPRGFHALIHIETVVKP